MKITFSSTSGTPFGEGHTDGPVPRVGDTFMNGSSEYAVTEITWQFDERDLECFVTVDRAG